MFEITWSYFRLVLNNSSSVIGLSSVKFYNERAICFEVAVFRDADQTQKSVNERRPQPQEDHRGANSRLSQLQIPDVKKKKNTDCIL